MGMSSTVTSVTPLDSTRTGRILLRMPRRQADRIVQAVDVERVLPPQLPDGRHARQRAVAPRRRGVQGLHIDVGEECLHMARWQQSGIGRWSSAAGTCGVRKSLSGARVFQQQPAQHRLQATVYGSGVGARTEAQAHTSAGSRCFSKKL